MNPELKPIIEEKFQTVTDSLKNHGINMSTDLAIATFLMLSEADDIELALLDASKAFAVATLPDNSPGR